MYKIMHLVPVCKEYSETFIWKHIDDVSCFFESSTVVCSKLNEGDDTAFSNYINLLVVNGKDTNIIRKLKFKLQCKIGLPTFFDMNDLILKVEAQKPSVIHAHFGYFLGDILSLTKLYTNKKFVISFHGTDINKIVMQSKSLQAALKSLSENSNVSFTFPSKFLKNVAFKLLGLTEKDNFDIIANPVDDAFIDSWTKSSFFKSSKLRLLSVGRLESVKGFEYAIKALSLLKEEGYDISYTIIGEGSARQYLKNVVSQHSLESHVFFTGKLEKKEIISYLSQSSIYLQPSVKLANGQEESFGVSALEAAVSGIPIVVSNSGGLPSVIDINNPNHYCVDEKNSEAIFTAVIDIIKNISYGYRNPAYINKFTSHTVLNDWREVYFD